jgi:hypothetical protein
MKKSFLIVLCFFIIGKVFCGGEDKFVNADGTFCESKEENAAKNVTNNAFTTTEISGLDWIGGNGHWEECRCSICGKRVYEYREGGIDWSGDSCFGYSQPYCEGEKVRVMKYSQELKVCENCWEKYYKEFDDYMSKYYDKWISKVQQQNTKSIRENELKIKEEDKKSIEERIKKLQDELNELQRP